MNHTCLCLPSRSWYSFTDPGGMEGWVGLGWLVGYNSSLLETILFQKSQLHLIFVRLQIHQFTALLACYLSAVVHVLQPDDFISHDCWHFPLQGAHWSWKVMEFWRTIFQAWKVMENSKGHGKSWKMMIMSWNIYYCTEKFCSRTANEVMLDRLLWNIWKSV